MHGAKACLSLAILVVCTQAFYQPPDPRLKAIRVTYVLSTTEPLIYNCKVNIDETDFVSIDKIEVSTDALSIGDDIFDALAAVQANPGEIALHNYLEEEIMVEGSINEELAGNKSHIDLTYKTLTGGNCLTYKCSVTGVKSDGSTEILEKEIKVRTADESPCSIKVSNIKIIRGLIPKIEECCSLASIVEGYEQDLETANVDLSALSSKAQENSNRVSQLLATAQSEALSMAVAQQHSTDIDNLLLRTSSFLMYADADLQSRDNKLQILENKLCELSNRIAEGERIAILEDTFILSEPFEGSIYALPKIVGNFNFDVESLRCQNAGGYLAEIDTEAERSFAYAFALENNLHFVYIGGNDRETEGQYVWKHSQRPMPAGLWSGGEPNNFPHITEGEDCVQFAWDGLLNDVVCTELMAPFMCELSETLPPSCLSVE